MTSALDRSHGGFREPWNVINGLTKQAPVVSEPREHGLEPPLLLSARFGIAQRECGTELP